MCSCYIKKLLNKIERFLLSSALIFFHCIRRKVMKGKTQLPPFYVSSLLQIKFFICEDMRECVFVCLHCKLGVLLHSKGKALSKIHFRLAQNIFKTSIQHSGVNRLRLLYHKRSMISKSTKTIWSFIDPMQLNDNFDSEFIRQRIEF